MTEFYRLPDKFETAGEGILRRYFKHPNISHEPGDCFMYSRVR